VNKRVRSLRALSSKESQLDSNSYREQNGGFVPIFFALQKSAELITQKTYGFNDEVATKKSNAKKQIIDML
jgi:hypothetical protein